LSDPDKRKQYDQMRRLGAFEGLPRRPAGARTAGAPGDLGSEGFDFGDFGGLGDIFSSIFGRGRREEPRADVLEAVVEVPFRVAMLGGKVPVTLPVTEPCPTCAGSGGAPGATWSTCPECNGRGTISFGQGGFAVNRPCPMCLGRGQVPSQPCPTCSGSGEVRTRKKVLITVPAGVDTGSKIRLKGQGGRGMNGGPPGDLLIDFTVQPDRFFRRDGLDVVATVPINIAQAALGSKVSVRTLEGKKVALRIPPGTSSGTRFRVRSQGIEKDGQRGDMIVEVTIRAPEALNDEQRAAMERFAESVGMKY
jgi:molecular chaperone DnaJ